ncbi:hypothetical protein [Pelagicoccus sp. SDUM812003]|uniref:hypothetical protein n=1 Tax=Pelagicoccus sp. SDUM812003 TaxID=3041267 RepID=UPI00280D924F|nr:hypothetical protein [Pelagicoccus sp. SDUM812003]MDQ8205756.1 hypothetical protein [Pelagicoccus sp. SDUM812003]
MKSPNGQFEVICTDFQEVRMGSPLFGRIELKETSFQLDGREFGEAMAFSKDSRFFAANQLRIAKGNPLYRIVVFDLQTEIEITVDSGDGLVRRIEWDE